MKELDILLANYFCRNGHFKFEPDSLIGDLLTKAAQQFSGRTAEDVAYLLVGIPEVNGIGAAEVASDIRVLGQDNSNSNTKSDVKEELLKKYNVSSLSDLKKAFGLKKACKKGTLNIIEKILVKYFLTLDAPIVLEDRLVPFNAWACLLATDKNAIYEMLEKEGMLPEYQQDTSVKDIIMVDNVVIWNKKIDTSKFKSNILNACDVAMGKNNPIAKLIFCSPMDVATFTLDNFKDAQLAIITSLYTGKLIKDELSEIGHSTIDLVDEKNKTNMLFYCGINDGNDVLFFSENERWELMDVGNLVPSLGKINSNPITVTRIVTDVQKVLNKLAKNKPTEKNRSRTNGINCF